VQLSLACLHFQVTRAYQTERADNSFLLEEVQWTPSDPGFWPREPQAAGL
jgi:hypothetical protein